MTHSLRFPVYVGDVTAGLTIPQCLPRCALNHRIVAMGVITSVNEVMFSSALVSNDYAKITQPILTNS